MKILISNDDGVHAEGIHALAHVFARAGKTVVVAPEKEKSTTGHSLTLHKPVRIHEYSKKIYSVSGGPADCIYIGIHEVLKARPDIVISGINRGANLGQDVFYSGTVSAAREAVIMGIPAIAVSLCLDHAKKNQKKHYDTAARATQHVLKELLRIFSLGKSEKAGLKAWPKGLLMNINVPNLPYNKIKGFKISTQGRQIYTGDVAKRIDSRGRKYYWIGGTYQGYEKTPGTDCFNVGQGYVAITPLELDTTMKDVHHHLENKFQLKK